MPNKAYLEITNACNLSCSFCHGTRRAIRYMSPSEFTLAATRLRPFADYLYFHLMGEPLLHHGIGDFLRIAGELGFRVILTTNGTLLKKKADVLLSAPALHKVSISLHAYEANEMGIPLYTYLGDCFDFCAEAAKKGIIAVMRLWNIGGEDALNSRILDALHTRFEGEWTETYSSYKLGEKIYLEWGEKFDWPDLSSPDYGGDHSCYGLRDQIGVLSDGTVVPCCLDADGEIALGNIFYEELDAILSKPRAIELKESFMRRSITEPLCRRCGFASKRIK